MTKLLSRRHLLMGTAGAMLPLPFLNAMFDERKTRQQPLRFVALFKPNGVHPPSWNIDGGSENDFQLSPMMMPFRDHKPDFLVVDNMGVTGVLVAPGLGTTISFRKIRSGQTWGRRLDRSVDRRQDQPRNPLPIAGTHDRRRVHQRSRNAAISP